MVKNFLPSTETMKKTLISKEVEAFYWHPHKQSIEKLRKKKQRQLKILLCTSRDLYFEKTSSLMTLSLSRSRIQIDNLKLWKLALWPKQTISQIMSAK